jgi:hypothetical protein
MARGDNKELVTKTMLNEAGDAILEGMDNIFIEQDKRFDKIDRWLDKVENQLGKVEVELSQMSKGEFRSSGLNKTQILIFEARHVFELISFKGKLKATGCLG